MKKEVSCLLKRFLITVFALLLGHQAIVAQDALTAVMINIQNVTISSDKKTISYDMYLQDVDATYPLAVCGYLFRLAVPQADLGTNAKTVTVTNASTELGVDNTVTMTISGSDWIMKFMSGNAILSYNSALVLSETFPGTLIGTFNISNSDGTSFANPQAFTATFAGTAPPLKSTVSIFNPNTTTLATNSNTAQPSTNFTGLQAYSLTAAQTPLTITGITASNKVYDGTTSVTLTGGTLVGVASGDEVSLVAGTGAFADKNVGNGKTIVASGYTLSGANASNYTLTQPTGITASITAASLTITEVKASDKVYDGKMTATLTGGTLNGIITGDVVTLVAGTGTFADKKVGTSKAVTATDYSLSGTDAGNYVVTQPAGITASITAVSLTISGVMANSKVYDGTTTATLTGGTLNGIITGDAVTLVTGTGTFADKNVGTEKTVTATGYSISGTDASNYTLSGQPTGLTANITASTANTLTITGITASNKVYDGTTKATLTGGTLAGVASGDEVSLVAGTGTFDDKNVGNGKTIFASGYTLSGANASNYTLIQPTGITANITAAPLTISAPKITLEKAYDGTTTAVVSAGILSGVIVTDAENVNIKAEANYDNASIGTNKTITVNYTLNGSEAYNYTAPSQTIVHIGEITAADTTTSITLTVTSPKITFSKTYDGTTSVDFTPGTLIGVNQQDEGNVILEAKAFYEDASVGTQKTITVKYTLTGSAANKYSLIAGQVYAGGEIKRKPLYVSEVNVVKTKTEDGNTMAEITSPGKLHGVIDTDVSQISLITQANYTDANVGTNKIILLTYSLEGNAKNNYLAPADSTLTDATIIAKIKLGQIDVSSINTKGPNVDISYSIVNGAPVQYKIQFDSTALKAGLQNMDYTNLTTDNSTINFAIPNGTKEGVYKATFTIRDAYGIDSVSYKFSFTVNLSADYIVKIYDDVATFNNADNRFVTYQWYKNGKLIPGATKQVYYEKDGLNGSYSLRLITTDGGLLYTYSKEFTSSASSSAVSIKACVYPNPVKSNQPFTVKVEGFNDTKLKGATLSIYSIKGIKVYQTKDIKETNVIELPLLSQDYIGHIKAADGTDISFKLKVNN